MSRRGMPAAFRLDLNAYLELGQFRNMVGGSCKISGEFVRA
jgi:hypothetical protein